MSCPNRKDFLEVVRLIYNSDICFVNQSEILTKIFFFLFMITGTVDKVEVSLETQYCPIVYIFQLHVY